MLWQTELAEALKAAVPSRRSDVLEGYEKMTGYSRQRLYDIARANGFDSGRRPRADKGSYKSELTVDQIEFIAALIHTSSREKKGAILPVEDALEIAIDNDIINRGQISVARLSQILAERQINAVALSHSEPHTEMRSLHPNHVHVLDASVCVQYYLKNGRTGLMDEKVFYKNKPENFDKIKMRILRYLIVDHFSGAFYPHYFNTTGETKQNLYDFVIKAWANKDDDKYPFHGVPFLMLMDQGSANIAKAILMFFRDRLGIEIPPGMPYAKTRQGTVEVMHNIWERHFESKLSFQPAWGVEDLNAWAFDYATFFNATKRHTRHGMTRAQCWLLIKQDQLRQLPAADILQDLFQEPEKECTVDGTYSISFRSKEYQLKHIEGLFRGAKVQAILKPYKYPVIDIQYKDALYEAQPLPDRLPAELGSFRQGAAIIGREYKAQPQTATQQAVKRFENMAYGETRKKDAIPFEGMKIHGIHADKVGNIGFIEKEGTPIEVDRAVANQDISFTQFLMELKREIGIIPMKLNQQLRAQYGESISKKQAEEVIYQIKAGTWPATASGAQDAVAM